MSATGGVRLDAQDRAECEAVTSRYLARLLGTAVTADNPHYAAGLERLDALLGYHAARYAEAGKRTDRGWLLEQLRAGRLAYREYQDCDLLEDVFLALLMERGVNEAFVAFQRRFAGQIERWARRYHPREPDLAGELAGYLFVPRAHAKSRIATYGGRAPLPSWLRWVVYTWKPEGRREHLVQLGDEAGGLDGFEGQPVARSSSCTVDGEFDRQNCRELLAPAFAECFDGLDATERLILFQYYVDGVQQTKIACELGVRNYRVNRIKQRAIALVRQRFHELAANLARVSRETVMNCLELLQGRFSDVPLDLDAIRAGEKARNSPDDDGP